MSLREEVEMECPICESEMKVNVDFQIAKCKSNFCGFLINWSSIPHRIATTLRLAQKIMQKNGRKLIR